MTALARVSDDLLLAAQSGDRRALTQLLVALQPDIRRYARRLCYRTSVIEDVVQEALIVVYRRVGTIRSPAALAGWLLTVIARLCMLPALMLMRGVEELASLEESRELAKVPPDELRVDLVNAIEFAFAVPSRSTAAARSRRSDDWGNRRAARRDARSGQKPPAPRPHIGARIPARHKGQRTREHMNYFRGVGMFGSAFLGAHLMRGAAAAALLAWAIVHQTAHPWLSLGAGVAALVALRGCPMCWTVGLVETLSQGRRNSTIRYDEAGDRDRVAIAGARWDL